MVPVTVASGTRSRSLLPSVARFPGHVVWRASARVEHVLEAVLPAGVDAHAHVTLLALEDGVSRSQQWLADRVGVSRTTMTKVAADLATRGLLERVRNAADRRSYALTRTTSGADAVQAWRPSVAAVEETLLDGFAPADRAELRLLLRRAALPILAPGLLPAVLDSTGFLITRLHHRMHADAAAALTDLDLEPRHLGSLTVLTSVGPIAQAELARHLGISGPSVVEIVDHLERRGLLERRRLATDRRTQVLHLLPGSEDVVTEMQRRCLTTSRMTLDVLTPAEVHRLIALLVAVVTGD